MRLRRWLYRIYRSYAGLSNVWRRRLTAAGWLAGVLMALSAAVGLNTSEAAAYQLFTLLAAAFALAVVHNLFFRPRLELTRHVPKFGSAGSRLTYRVRVRNRGRRRHTALCLREALKEPVPEQAAFFEEPEPGERARNRFDRTFLFYRWTWLRERARAARVADSAFFPVQPGGELDVPMQIDLLRRGVLRLTRMQVGRPDLFGLLKSLRIVPCAQETTVTVLPKRYPLRPVTLGGRARYQPCGAVLAGAVGQSDEFVGLREYRPGDPVRHLHWRSWARTGKPIVREFQDEFFPRYALALDTFAPYDRRNVFEEAVSVAASFACTLDTKESLLDLMFVGPEAYCFTSGRGTAQPERLLQILAAVDLCRTKPFTDLDRLIQSHVRDVSACICVFIDWDDARRTCVERLQARGIEMLVLVIRPPGAAPPETAANGHVRFLDASRVAEGLARL